MRCLSCQMNDSLPADLVCALPALWTGLFYDTKALDEAEELTRDFTFAELESIRPSIVERALQTPSGIASRRAANERSPSSRTSIPSASAPAIYANACCCNSKPSIRPTLSRSRSFPNI